ncbi:Imm49 family immunity protein [Haloarcula sp. JP-L23]|uniref:Imm49 family immunity protein n=1 Tax=Haloarcula sp. JP-L23 TaxID=2716717 RepID=UPI00140EA383|nr:hypothetical protein G9465_12995 [Haloarcula sp. JP-L23]
MRDADPSILEAGIESMLSFHEQDSHQDNVVDQVMAVQATALLVLARVHGYDIPIESPLLPDDPANQAVSRLNL